MPVWLLLVICCACAPRLRADDQLLIRIGEVWQYLKGFQEPSDPLGSWRLQEFDDGRWAESISGFSLNFSDYNPEPGHLFDYGFGYRTVYFRKTFHVEKPESLAELTLRLDYDDGFVAYINGQEVARRNVAGLPDVPIPSRIFATNYHNRGPTEEVNCGSGLPFLKPGENLLAVQMLGWGTNDYSVAFVPELLGNFTRGPIVQNTTSNSTQIIFKTLSPVSGFVELRTSPENLQRILLPGSPTNNLVTNHVATLTNLAPDTVYEYRIGAAFPGKEALSDWHSFRTFKPSGRFSFAVTADTGWGSPAQYQIADQMRAAQPDLVMLVGDIAYPYYSHFVEDFRCFSVYADHMATTPYFLVFGNHEGYGGVTPALESFYLPTNNFTGTEHYYSFDHGDAHFVAVWADIQAGADYSPGSTQYKWIEQDLANTSKPWKFMLFHHVWRSSSFHGSDDYDYNSIPDWMQMEQGPIALARKYGVQIVFNGHDHDYERFTPSGGLMSFVTGGGGAYPYGLRRLHPDSVHFYFQKYEFIKVTVDRDEALLQAVGVDGKAFDQVHLHRSLPERKIFKATWNSPRIEQFAPTDGDGNVPGQMFDFRGDAIGAKVGQHSATGRLFVNNDNDNLYVGIDEAMLHTGDELFLFLEGLSGHGVTNMTNFALPLGSTNSLQTLATLVFTNFAPSIGVVLGDEFGDGGYSVFTRAGSSNNTGQGAFSLTNGFPLVAGQRLTQFNFSPQTETILYEQNSDFIKLALPYASLGLHPGDRLKVGAIIGLRNSDTNSPSAPRALDSGIGYSVVTENGLTYLEPVEIQLEGDRDADDDGLRDDEEITHGTNPSNPDTDGDGMSDGWELANGFDPLKPNDASADADNDRMSNLGEFIAGTDPRNAASRLSASVLRSPTGYNLQWNSMPGRLYKIQARDGLQGTFEDLTDPLLPRRAELPTESYPIQISPDSPAQYYRVVVIPE
jgi:hypothetical protein